MNKEIIFFILKMLIIVILPKILTCISAAKLLELTKENPKLCKNPQNANNFFICSKKDKESEITYIDKYNLIKDALKNVSHNRLKSISQATIALAVLAMVFTLIANILKFTINPQWLNDNSRTTLGQIPKILSIIAIIIQFFTAMLLYTCFAYFMNIFKYHEKKEEYKKIFIATVIIDFMFFWIGVYILFK